MTAKLSPAFALQGSRVATPVGVKGLQVPAHHGEPMLQGGGGDEPIGAVVSEGGRELAPAASTPDAPLPLYARRQDLPDSS
jgi:hypothetical protein